ncbi:MAG TPA: hypothetical protein VE404_09780 [Verrucomicrobiae bacterium]|nr:hypothetical protein [Verrucomicrobiae bacterium]
MKRPAMILFSFLMAAAVPGGVGAAIADGAMHAAAAPPLPAFEKLKSLAGEWKSAEGGVTVSYRVVSGGSALVEEMSHGSMVTVYHRDGDRLMMTHYCESQNQPRMRTDVMKGDPQSVKFSMVDITNLEKPTDGHMSGLTISFVDKDHFNADWNYLEGGKETPAAFHYTRVK